METTRRATVDASWNGLYRIAGTAALLTVLVGVIEMTITFLPSGSASPETVVDWFNLLQDHWFLGLRNLGLLNLFLTLLGIPLYLALYVAHRAHNRTCAALAAMVSVVGLAVFLGTNRAFPMLALSREYDAATTDAQRAALVAAGKAMLTVGQSHVAGTFVGFFLSEVAGITISVVMLRGRVFGPVNAYAGILGFALLLIHEVASSFVPGSSHGVLMVAMVGGLLNVTWTLLTARRLFQLRQDAPQA